MENDLSQFGVPTQYGIQNDQNRLSKVPRDGGISINLMFLDDFDRFSAIGTPKSSMFDMFNKVFG